MKVVTMRNIANRLVILKQSVEKDEEQNTFTYEVIGRRFMLRAMEVSCKRDRCFNHTLQRVELKKNKSYVSQ